MASGHVPHGQQLISLPLSSSGQNHVSVIARTSMLPGKQQIMRSSAQGRFKNCAPSSSRVKGGKEMPAEDPDCQEREREIIASNQEPVRGDGGHDHMEHRSGALPGEGTAEFLSRGLNQEIDQEDLPENVVTTQVPGYMEHMLKIQRVLV
jgi:hypothetical protein